MIVLSLSTMLLLLVTLEAAVIAVVAWRLRPKPGAFTLSILMASVTLWTGSIVVSVVVEGYTLTRLFVNLTFVGTSLTVAALVAFSLEFTGRERFLKWPYPLLLAFEPVVVLVLTFSNDLSGLFWERVYQDAAHYTGYQHVPAAAANLHLAFTYFVTTGAILLIVQKLFRTRSTHRTQTVAVLIGVLAPLVGNVLLVFDVLQMGQTVGFAVTGVAMYWSVSRGNLIDLFPVARTTVLEEIDVGILVLDRDERIIDINPRARGLLDISPDESCIARPGSAVFDQTLLPEVDGLAVETTTETTIDDEQRLVQIHGSQLTDALDRDVGLLFLFDDVTDDEQRKAELRSQNERLQEFAGLVSHDLRNPLDVASGYVELMRQGTDQQETVVVERERLDATADAIERMEMIVDDVLMMAREGETVTDPEMISLRSAARTAWDHVDTADAKLFVGTDAMIVADRGQLQRLFENLFRNAVEHGGPDVTVSVSTISGTDGPVGFYIEDDGPGIPPSDRERVFHSGMTSDAHGTGFGLAIVDELASAHDWEITVTDGDDDGARFEITGATITGDRLIAGDRPTSP